MAYWLGKLEAIARAMIFLIACGGGAEPTPVAVALKAEVCTEGEVRDARLYIRNLGEYEWRGVTISLVKSGYSYRREWASLLPHSDQAASPIIDSTDFKYISDTPGDPEQFLNPVYRLQNFGHLDAATIQIDEPHQGEWTGAVQPCQ